MIINNLSTNEIVLIDNDSNQYTIPALNTLFINDSLLNDNTFRKWLKWRIRDLVINPTPVIERIGGYISSSGVPIRGTGFLVNHSATGVYILTFTIPFTLVPVVNATI